MDLQEYDSQRRTVPSGGGTVGYTDVGTGRAALFVHGVGTNGSLWRHAIEQLRGERRCVALDLPLHGHSPAAPDQDLSLTGLAAVVEDFCARLDLTDVDLVANDTGGAVAQIVAAHEPHRLATLTLTNCETVGNVPPRPFRPTVRLARAGLLAPLSRRALRDLPRARRAVFGKGYEDLRALPDDVLRGYLEPLLGSRESARQLQRWVAALHDRDLVAVQPQLRRLMVPTLLVWGTGDVFFPIRWARGLQDTVPGVTELVQLDGARLFFPDERAGELVPHLRRHWAAHPVGGRPG